ncbi:MAG: hypothetical protein ED559_03675 [Phycisphaera sp.]|nr:MAG: hypothetical protein ED559_03675 [Phycisphaera sp.]
MKKHTAAILGAAAVLAAGGFTARAVFQPTDAERMPEVAQADLDAIDEAIVALYDVISGPAGEERDWDRFRAMFTSTAHMGACFTRPDGLVNSITMTPEEYIERSGQMLVQIGFTERETHRVLEVYGSIAHAFSTYEGIGNADAETPLEVAGVNSIQLIRTDDGWKVFSLIWNQASAEIPVPVRYTAQDK